MSDSETKWDGIAVIDYASKEDWAEMANSAEWKAKGAPDTASCALVFVPEF